MLHLLQNVPRAVISNTHSKLPALANKSKHHERGKSSATTAPTVNVQACALGGSAKKGSFLSVDQNERKTKMLIIRMYQTKLTNVCMPIYAS